MSESLKKKTTRALIWSSIERFSTQGLGFAFGVLLARLLSPGDYGIIAMLGIFLSLAQCFIDSGFSSALIRKTDRTEADYSTTFYFNIVVGIVCYLILFFTAPWIADFYNTPILTPITRLIGLTLILNSLCAVQQAIFTITLDFKTQAKISLISLLISAPAGLACAYCGWAVWSLVVQTILGATARTALLWCYAKWKPQAPFSKDSFKELFGFGSKLLASGLLDTVYSNLYTIIIGKYFSKADLGFYDKANKFAQLPSSNITGILQRVTFPVLSNIQDDDERLSHHYRKFLKLSAFIVFPLMIGLAAMADPLIRLILTDKWAPCIPYLQVLCLSLMWYPIHAINLNLLQVKGRSDLFLKLEIYKKILITITLCTTVPFGILVMCAGKIFNSLVALMMNTFYTGKMIQLGYWKQMRDLTPILLNSLIMGGIAYTVQLYTPMLICKILAGCLAGGVYYIVSNILMKSPEWQETINLLRRKKS